MSHPRWDCARCHLGRVGRLLLHLLYRLLNLLLHLLLNNWLLLHYLGLLLDWLLLHLTASLWVCPWLLGLWLLPCLVLLLLHRLLLHLLYRLLNHLLWLLLHLLLNRLLLHLGHRLLHLHLLDWLLHHRLLHRHAATKTGRLLHTTRGANTRGTNASRFRVCRTQLDIFGDVAVSGDIVARFVLAAGWFDLDADLQRDAVQLLAVFDLQNADGVGQGRQLFERDILGDRVVVLDVETGEHLAASVLHGLLDGQGYGQTGAGTVAGWLDVGLGDRRNVPASRNRISDTGIRGDVCSVEVEHCHY